LLFGIIYYCEYFQIFLIVEFFFMVTRCAQSWGPIRVLMVSRARRLNNKKQYSFKKIGACIAVPLLKLMARAGMLHT
jgi:hypothetical protein